MELITPSKKSLRLLINERTQKWLETQTTPLRTLMAYYRCAIMEIETKFNVLNEQFSLKHDRNPIASVKSRLKSMESIAEKLQRKNLPLSCEAIENNINDVAGIRVVCSFTDDVYMLADAFIKQDDITLIEIKDYIQTPKPGGYRSLHLIVEVPIFLADEKRQMRAEIQMRTIAMDFWASLEHQLLYKKDVPNVEEISKELKLCAEESANLDKRMSEIKQKIIPND